MPIQQRVDKLNSERACADAGNAGSRVPTAHGTQHHTGLKQMRSNKLWRRTELDKKPRNAAAHSKNETTSKKLWRKTEWDRNKALLFEEDFYLRERRAGGRVRAFYASSCELTLAALSFCFCTWERRSFSRLVSGSRIRRKSESGA